MVIHALLGAGRVLRRLFEGELIDRRRRLAIGQAGERPRHGQRHEAGILAFAVAAPFGVFDGIEDLLQVAGLGQLRVILEAEHLRVRRRDERRERCRGDIGHAAQQLDVLRVIGELVIADQRTVRLAARGAELVFIDLLERLALVEFDRLAEVLVKVLFLDVQAADLEAGTGLRVHHQMVQATPAAFHLLEFLVVHHGVELLRHLRVDRRNRLVEGDRQVLRIGDGALQGLFGQRFEQFLCPVGLGLLGCSDRLIEQAKLGRAIRGFRSGLGLFFGRAHDYFSSPPSSPAGASTPS